MTTSTASAPSLWPAPAGHAGLDAVVEVPGSKSVTNRALVLAALADAPSVVRRPLRARDTVLMAGALRSLGARVDDDGDDWRVTPLPRGERLEGGADVHCGLAGTVMRFVPPVAALVDGDVRFDGDEQAYVRPMGTVLGALRALGARVDGDRLPFVVHATGTVAGGEVVLDASSSSQFVSALLLAGARYERGVTVLHQGPPVPSLPHIAMTVQMLRAAGVEVDDATPDRWHVPAGPVRPTDVDVEPDLSNAAPFLAAALVTGGRVTVPGWPRSTTQAGDALRDLLAAMGARVDLTDAGLTVTGTGRIEGLDADLHDVGELTPVLAALCALAATPSRLRGIAHLRHHETDRLAALATEVNGLGGHVEVTDDGLAITPRPLHGGAWASYADHRMATAGAVLGLAVPGVAVEDVGTTAKTLPDFPGMWAAMLTRDDAGEAS